VVLDIGANVGTFALAALRRGAGSVFCFEPDADNFRQLSENLSAFSDRVRLHRCAVWRSDRSITTTLSLHNPDCPENTGAIQVTTVPTQQTVPARAFDLLLAEIAGEHGHIDLVKFDCEGAEWPILYTSRLLDRIDRICGEYHLGEWSEVFRVAGLDCVPEALAHFLERHGFAVEISPHPDAPQRLGHFFAARC
jgi:FkbM family methyltransferase